MQPRLTRFVSNVASGIVLATLAFVGGCESSPDAKDSQTMTRPAGEPGVGQQLFDTDDQAVAALVAAAKAHDTVAMNKIMGPSIKELVTGDKVQDDSAYDRFAKDAAEHLELEKRDANTTVMVLRKDKWPFPIPVTKTAGGKWFFDTEAGKDELLSRKIGGNELETIKVCRAYVEAQREYASKIRDDSGVNKYAQHFISKHGKDGLYWEAKPGEEESPFGEMIAQATMKGYSTSDEQNATSRPYFGYVYRIITRQGSNAPGGSYNYVINGNMIAGFALITCPTEYGVSGVMTFIISHQGKLYQKDLGPKSEEVAKGITEFNPDSSWTLVED